MAQGEPMPPDPERAWTAEVGWRRTDRKARFVVKACPMGSGTSTTIAESPPLAWPPTDAASVEALTAAAHALHSALRGAGWTALDQGDAWYAERFAWEPSVPAQDAGLFAPVPTWPESTAGRWRCEITWDAGWAESRFQAVAYRPRRRRGRAIGASSGLRWPLMGRPDALRKEHREAVRGIADALEAVGWQRAGRGSHWYSERFAWPHDGAPPDRLEAVPSPPDERLSENVSLTRIQSW
jgi:hypothetical protein